VLWGGWMIWSRRPRVHVVPFHLSYGFSPDRIIEAVNGALATDPIEGLRKKPEPRCVVIECHPGHITFGVLARAASDDHKKVVAISEILLRVDQAMKGLDIPLGTVKPQTAPPAPVPEPAPPRPEPPAGPTESTIAKYCNILRSIPIFRGLPEEAVTRLAPSLTDAYFGPGDYIVRQGDESGSMYIVVQGAVDVNINGDGGATVFIARLEAGQFFGELSVFTGEKRTANVVATTLVECLVVDKPSLMSVFDWRPELAEDIAEVIMQRQAGLAASKELLAAQERTAVLERIHSHFGIRTEAGHNSGPL
jgi:CRP-like cAMP-binding protein